MRAFLPHSMYSFLVTCLAADPLMRIDNGPPPLSKFEAGHLILDIIRYHRFNVVSGTRKQCNWPRHTGCDSCRRHKRVMRQKVGQQRKLSFLCGSDAANRA
ncbi:hypothetical protein QBC45DRAFT_403471 [Copromyces sp. CBS 386.78]|nr:hypothetical protein QBC45DRAFT_403471 [Copromyces sp. CBS 386.78]